MTVYLEKSCVRRVAYWNIRFNEAGYQWRRRLNIEIRRWSKMPTSGENWQLARKTEPERAY